MSTTMMPTTMMPTKPSSTMMSSMVSTKPTSMMPTKPRSTHPSMMSMMPMTTTHSHTKSPTTMMMVMMSSTKPSRTRVKASHASTRTELVSSRRWISASAHSHTGTHMMTTITAAEEGEARAHVVSLVVTTGSGSKGKRVQ
ncbi:unnamed protein product [Aspergillus oryzae RIB40]|uniref:DNA, SC003 n=1 Tax=Aspergillus oryzae (strain ATCC 42149 / RIB 40) TaxID=510516 RepID=Q2UJ41_ASPOR|nr:unnamed protein product [Aspergillus oryzae RIB40]BAE58424.1 unnamed protein product [Aspergillus oryzae RIB40]